MASASTSFRVARRLANRVANGLPTLATPQGSAIGVSWLQVGQVEDLQSEVLEVAVAVGLLDEPPDLVVEPLGLCVRRASELPEPEHALEVFLYGLRHLLELCDVRRLRLFDPVEEHRLGRTLRLAVQVDVPQPFLHDIGLAKVLVLVEHPVELLLRLGILLDVLLVHEGEAHVALERLLGLLLPLLLGLDCGKDLFLRHLLDVKLADAPPHVGRDPRHRLAPNAVDVVVHRLDDVEVVVDDGHAGKVLAHPLAVGVGHVHADAFDVRFLRPQPPPEALECVAALAARDVQHGAGLHVPHHGDVLAVGAFVAEDVQLVDADHAHPLEVDAPVLGVEDPLFGVLDGVRVDVKPFGHRRDRHLRAQLEHLPLEGPCHARLGAGQERDLLAELLPALPAADPTNLHLDVDPDPAEVEAADAAELALAELEVIALAALALAPLALGRLRLQPEDYDDVPLPRPHAQRMLRVGPGEELRLLDDQGDGSQHDDEGKPPQEGEFAPFEDAAADEAVRVPDLALLAAPNQFLARHAITADACGRIYPRTMHNLLL